MCKDRKILSYNQFLLSLQDTNFYSLNIMDKERNSAAPNEDIMVLEALDPKGIILKFNELVESGDSQNLFRYAEVFKSVFYKKVNELKENGEVDLSEEESAFKELYAKYKVCRQTYAEEMEKVKEENCAVKLQIIEELKALLEKTEDVNVTFSEFRELQNRWKSVDMVPQTKAKDLWDTYQHYVEKFYDYIKINNEFRDMDFKKNLEVKEQFCAIAEKLAENDYIEYVVKVVFDEVNSKILASILAPEASDTCRCVDLEDCQSRMHIKFSSEGGAD